MSYFIDDDTSQIRALKDEVAKLQAQLLGFVPSSATLENVESGQSIFPGANPSARVGGIGGSGGGTGGTFSFPIRPPVLQVLNSSGTNLISLSDSTAHSARIDAVSNITLAFSGYPSDLTQIEWEVEVKNIDTNPITVTLPPEVQEISSLSIPVGQKAILIFRTNDGGATVNVVENGGLSSTFDPLILKIVDHGTIGLVTENIDLSVLGGNFHKMILSGDVSLAFNNPPAMSGSVERFVIHVAQDGTGGHILSFPATVVNPPTVGTASGEITRIEFYTFDSGASYHAFVSVSGGSGTGANTFLSNLTSPTSINQALLPNAASSLDLGSELLPWRIGHFREIEFPDITNPPNSVTDTQISKNTSGNLAFNVDTVGASFLFYFQGNNTFAIGQSAVTASDGLIIGDGTSGQGKIILNDAISMIGPANGYIYREGPDIKVFTGGVERNLSTITSPGSPTDWANFPAINTVLPDAASTRDIGSELLPFRIAHLREIEFPVTTSTPSAITDTQISKNTSGNLSFNVDTPGAGFQFYFEGLNMWGMTSTSFAGPNIILTGSLTLNDSGNALPSVGQFSRSGSDIFVQTSSGVKNLDDIGSGGGGAHDLGSHTDVTITSPAANHVLFYNGANWDNRLLDLGDLSDVQTAGSVSGEFLRYNGTFWEDQDIVVGDLPSTVVLTNIVQNITSQKTFDGTGISLVVTNRANFNGDVHLGNSIADEIHMDGEVKTDILIDGGQKVQSNDSASEIGFLVTDDSGSVGADGTIQIPSNTGSATSASGANSRFGSFRGAIGIYESSGGTPILVVRKNNGDWAGVLLNQLLT